MNKYLLTLLLVIFIFSIFSGIIAFIINKQKNKFTNVSYKEEENINN